MSVQPASMFTNTTLRNTGVSRYVYIYTVQHKIKDGLPSLAIPLIIATSHSWLSRNDQITQAHLLSYGGFPVKPINRSSDQDNQDLLIGTPLSYTRRYTRTYTFSCHCSSMHCAHLLQYILKVQYCPHTIFNH